MIHERTLALMILPFAEKDMYLMLSSVSKTWKSVLDKLKYNKQTDLRNVVLSLNLLQWARRSHVLQDTSMYENDCPWDEWICAHAARGGHLEVLQWARENGCPWNERTCANAASGGHLHVLQWARNNGCPWDVWTCIIAAQNGHLHVLQWARENGCPWDILTFVNAAFEGHRHVLQWARRSLALQNASMRANGVP